MDFILSLKLNAFLIKVTFVPVRRLLCDIQIDLEIGFQMIGTWLSSSLLGFPGFEPDLLYIPDTPTACAGLQFCQEFSMARYLHLVCASCRISFIVIEGAAYFGSSSENYKSYFICRKGKFLPVNGTEYSEEDILDRE